MKLIDQRLIKSSASSTCSRASSRQYKNSCFKVLPAQEERENILIIENKLNETLKIADSFSTEFKNFKTSSSDEDCDNDDDDDDFINDSNYLSQLEKKSKVEKPPRSDSSDQEEEDLKLNTSSLINLINIKTLLKKNRKQTTRTNETFFDKQKTASLSNSDNNANCLKTICENNKLYLKKIYNNFDLVYFNLIDEQQTNKTKITTNNHQEQPKVIKKLPELIESYSLDMNSIQLNGKQQQQTSTKLIVQNKQQKKPHWINIATLGKAVDVKRNHNNYSNFKQHSNRKKSCIEKQKQREKPVVVVENTNEINSNQSCLSPHAQQSLIFLSTISSLSEVTNNLHQHPYHHSNSIHIRPKLHRDSLKVDGMSLEQLRSFSPNAKTKTKSKTNSKSNNKSLASVLHKPEMTSLGKSHSQNLQNLYTKERAFSELKSKSASSTANNFNEDSLNRSITNLTSTTSLDELNQNQTNTTTEYLKLPDLARQKTNKSSLDLANDQNESETRVTQTNRQNSRSFITQTSIYKKLAEYQRQSTYEYLKFVTVKNLRAANKPTDTNGLVVKPHISKKVLQQVNLTENTNSTEKNEDSSEMSKSQIRIRNISKKVTLNCYKDKLNRLNNRKSCFNENSIISSNISEINKDELSKENQSITDEASLFYCVSESAGFDQQQLDTLNENENSNTSRENSCSSESTNLSDKQKESEPTLNKSKGVYTHILTSSSQLKDIHNNMDKDFLKGYRRAKSHLNRVSFSNENLEFIHNELQVNKLHKQVVQQIETSAAPNESRLFNSLLMNQINFNSSLKTNSDVYKYYERTRTSNLLSSIKLKQAKIDLDNLALQIEQQQQQQVDKEEEMLIMK